MAHAAPPTATTALETLLADLLQAHEALQGNLREQRTAVSGADAAGLAACTQRQQAIVARIAELEQQRRELVVRVMRESPGLARGAGGQPTLESICSTLPEPDRTRARELAHRLRELIGAVRQEASTLRSATATLVAHMDGLMAQVGRRLSHAGTYSGPGCPRAAETVVSGIDLTS